MPVLDDLDALVMPIVSGERHFNRSWSIACRRLPSPAGRSGSRQPLNNEGHIVIRLNRKVMTERMFQASGKAFLLGRISAFSRGQRRAIVYGENGGEDGSAGAYNQATMILLPTARWTFPSDGRTAGIVDQRIEANRDDLAFAGTRTRQHLHSRCGARMERGSEVR